MQSRWTEEGWRDGRIKETQEISLNGFGTECCFPDEEIAIKGRQTGGH